jgi:hypothetical protein
MNAVKQLTFSGPAFVQNKSRFFLAYCKRTISRFLIILANLIGVQFFVVLKANE